MAKKGDLRVISLLSIFVLNIGLASLAYAKKPIEFSVVEKCKDGSCAIYTKLGDKLSLLDNDLRVHNINKMNQSLYRVEYSCGNECSNFWFINSAGKEDITDTLVASEGQCLIEYDMNKRIFSSRKVFSKVSQQILDISNNRKLYEPANPIFIYRNDASFEKGLLVLNLLDKNYNHTTYKIANPCHSL